MDEKEEKKVNGEIKETAKELKKDGIKEIKTNKKTTTSANTVKKGTSTKQNIKKQKNKEEVTKKSTSTTDEKKDDINSEVSQIDYTFKKVENVNVKKEKKESFIGKLFKAILIVIIILIICYCIFVARNFMILRNIQEKTTQYKNLTNYSYQTKGITNDYTSDVYCSKNNDVSRLDLQIHLNTGEERSLIIWNNKSTNESIAVFPTEKEALTSNIEDGNIVMSEATFPFQVASDGDSIKWLSLSALIYSEEINGKDCYVIQVAPDSKKWVEKETGFVLKNQIGDIVTEVVNIEIDTVSEIYKPDLTGYKITKQE